MSDVWTPAERCTDVLGAVRGSGPLEPVRRYERKCQAYAWRLPDGTLHRLDGPAVEYRAGPRRGDLEWFVEGLLHREEGPAILNPAGNGESAWYRYGKLDRRVGNGPTIDINGGEVLAWVRDGKLHRIDGPALINNQPPGPGIDLVFTDTGLNGKVEQDTAWRVGLNANEEWWVDGVAHREDGPAKLWKKEFGWRQEWWLDGELHREDGPAIVEHGEQNEHSEWYRHGERHRVGGPAVESTNLPEINAWYENGQRHREDGPAWTMNGISFWSYRGKLHREGGPAVESDDHKRWYRYGVKHREDGPAIEKRDGAVEWWLDGQELTEEEFATRSGALRS